MSHPVLRPDLHTPLMSAVFRPLADSLSSILSISGLSCKNTQDIFLLYTIKEPEMHTDLQGKCQENFMVLCPLLFIPLSLNFSSAPKSPWVRLAFTAQTPSWC